MRGFGQVLLGGVSIKDDDSVFGELPRPTLQSDRGASPSGQRERRTAARSRYLRVMASDTGEVLGGGDLNGFRFAVGVSFGIGSR